MTIFYFCERILSIIIILLIIKFHLNVKISFHFKFIEVIGNLPLDYLCFIEEMKHNYVHKLKEFMKDSLGSGGTLNCNYDN